jgi:hypothetical protein
VGTRLTPPHMNQQQQQQQQQQKAAAATFSNMTSLPFQ